MWPLFFQYKMSEVFCRVFTRYKFRPVDICACNSVLFAHFSSQISTEAMKIFAYVGAASVCPAHWPTFCDIKRKKDPRRKNIWKQPNKVFDQLWGAYSIQKLIKIYNGSNGGRAPLISKKPLRVIFFLGGGGLRVSLTGFLVDLKNLSPARSGLSPS